MRRLRAEWECQSAILMAFPHAKSDWKIYLKEARETFLQIMEAILPHQKLLLCIHPSDREGEELVRDRLRDFLRDGKLLLAHIPTNDTWARDFGPISIEENGRTLALDFGFNGWGLKFPSNLDNQISSRLKDLGFLQNCITQDLILEGGSIDSDGEGVLLTNTQCLLEKNRNPSYTKEMLDQRLKKDLGLTQIHWLNHGYLAGDDTDSHIDTLARFLNPNTIAYVHCEDAEDEHFLELQKMRQELGALRTKEGLPYKLIPLPLPNIEYDGERLPASYANFLLINDRKLLLPTYGVPELDALAIQALSPYYDVLPMDCSILIRQHGSLHCVTMQLYEDL